MSETKHVYKSKTFQEFKTGPRKIQLPHNLKFEGTYYSLEILFINGHCEAAYRCLSGDEIRPTDQLIPTGYDTQEKPGKEAEELTETQQTQLQALKSITEDITKPAPQPIPPGKGIDGKQQESKFMTTLIKDQGHSLNHAIRNLHSQYKRLPIK